MASQLWIFILGMAVPFYAAAKTAPAGSPLGFFRSPNPWPLPPPALLFLVFGLALFLRFYPLAGFTVWPLRDESYNSFFPLELSEKWNWTLTYGGEPCPPGTTWVQGLFFKMFTPSLASHWALSALASMLFLPLAYAVSRRFSNPSLALFYAALAGFNFWPLFLLVISEANFNIFWQFVLFLGLAPFLLKEKKNTGSAAALALGMGLGMGWIFSRFLLINLLFLFPLAVWAVGTSPAQHRSKIKLLAFGFGFLLCSLPLVLLGWEGRLGSYSSKILSFLHPLDMTRDQWRLFLSYITSLFWGRSQQDYFTFGPYWGGFFNPLLAAAFFLGLAKMLRWGKKTILFSIFLVVVGLGFNLFSNTLELVRVFPLFPFLLIPMTVGWVSLLSSIPFERRGLLTAGFLALSLGLDLCHLAIPYFSWSIPGRDSIGVKFVEPYRASQILKRTADNLGPGLIFDNFLPDDYDRSLLFATYPFNADRNPSLSPGQAQWAGLLTLKGEGPYLLQRFPGTRLYALPSSSRDPDALHGPALLAVIPIRPEDRALFQGWGKARRFFDQLFETYPFHSFEAPRASLAALTAEKNLAGQDPLLQSIWIEKAFFLNQRILDPERSREWIQQCDPRLLPGNFWNPLRGQAYHQLGYVLVRHQEYSKARRAFLESGKWDPALKPRPEILQRLDFMEKQKNGPKANP